MAKRLSPLYYPSTPDPGSRCPGSRCGDRGATRFGRPEPKVLAPRSSADRGATRFGELRGTLIEVPPSSENPPRARCHPLRREVGIEGTDRGAARGARPSEVPPSSGSFGSGGLRCRGRAAELGIEVRIEVPAIEVPPSSGEPLPIEVPPASGIGPRGSRCHPLQLEVLSSRCHPLRGARSEVPRARGAPDRGARIEVPPSSGDACPGSRCCRIEVPGSGPEVPPASGAPGSRCHPLRGRSGRSMR